MKHMMLTSNMLTRFSPWWLQRQGRFQDAEKSLKRLASPIVDVKPALAMIVETDKLEREMEAGATYLDCFKKINLRRTEISVGVYVIQVLCGIYLVGYGKSLRNIQACEMR
jgi:MFS transporter, SP family, general alpha glucoside:H+ symporter